MESVSTTPSRYPACDSVKRQPTNTYVSPDIIKKLEEEAVFLPLYQLKIYEYIQMKHNSLETNELLRCRWNQFKSDYGTRKTVPFVAPKAKDIHFYNGYARFIPSETIGCAGCDYRKKLTFQYKVDERGITPIPVEAHSRHTKQKK